MKLISWLLVAIVGLAIMATAYLSYIRLDADTPWSSGLICIDNDVHSELPKPMGSKYFATTVRELPPRPIGAVLISGLNRSRKARFRNLAPQMCEKLLLVDPQEAKIGDKELLSGRMPHAGHDEVLAGYEASAKNRLSIEGHDFTVVGILRRERGAFCQLLPVSEFGWPDGGLREDSRPLRRNPPLAGRGDGGARPGCAAGSLAATGLGSNGDGAPLWRSARSRMR